MRKQIIIAAIGTIAGFQALQAQAALITFDDITTGSFAFIPSDYNGLNWNNLAANNKDMIPGSVYDTGVVSPKYAAFNLSGNGASISGNSLPVFDFVSVYLASVFYDNHLVTVTGYSGSIVKYNQTVSLDMHSVLFNFNFDSVTSVTFNTSPENFNGSQFIMDNMTINAVPEPSTYLAGLSALGMLGLFGWRNRK